jgi:hypothetical protein
LDKIKVKVTRNVVVWDLEAGITIDSAGMFDREGKALDAVPLTDFINRKLREGILEVVKDASDIKSDNLLDKDKKQTRRSGK